MKKAVFLFAIFCTVVFGDTVKVIKPKTDFNNSFCIVIDHKTEEKCSHSLSLYSKSLEKDSLNPFIMIINQSNPMEIREDLRDLYKENHLRGAVFVGDIPVPMLRDAQHLTSAFKMDQEKFSMKQSSIPSDRFYEDFDLKFEFIQQDSMEQLLYYYTLKAESPQRIEKEIYTGRVFPAVDAALKYEVIRSFLNKAAEYKNHPEKMDQALFTLGHGYYSESMTAVESEILTLKEQFPQFFTVQGRLKYYNHAMSVRLKSIIKRELQNPVYDMAVFHAHGSPELQYILGDPPTPTISSKIYEIKQYLRGKLRDGKMRDKSVDSLKLFFMNSMGIDSSWFEGVFEDSIMIRDSLSGLEIDMQISDVREIEPQPYLIIFDQCFNGRFIETPYISGEYVFHQKGRTLAGIANSVNVLQDIWPDENLEYLNFGKSIGEWHKTRPYLESHIIGDPTFRFHHHSNMDMNKKFYQNDDLLNHENPMARSIYVSQMNDFDDRKIELLYEKYFHESSMIVRTQIVKQICRSRSSLMDSILLYSIFDPYELLRRKTTTIMGDRGMKIFIRPLLISRFLDESPRVRFNAGNALKHFDLNSVLMELVELLKEQPAYFPDKEHCEKDLKSLVSSDEYLMKSIQTIEDTSLSMKKRISSVRMYRNQNIHSLIPEFLRIASSIDADTEIRTAIIELCGWFYYSFQRQKIINTLDSLVKDDNQPEKIKKEALKSINRLLSGPNHPFTP